MGSIFNMFGPSPIKPIEQHMHKAHCCAKRLPAFFEATLADDWQQAKSLHQEIIALEKEADAMKIDLRLHLPAGLFLPVPRTDLLALLTKQDRLANKSKDIAGLVMGRHLVLPPSIAAVYLPFLERCVDASRQACKAINELDELLESGFSGSEITIVEDMLRTLNKIENDSDEMLMAIQKRIFDLETTLPAIQIIFLYKLVDWTGNLADIAQTIGGRLQLLLAR